MAFGKGNKLGKNGAKKKQEQIKDLLMHLSPKAIKRLEQMLDSPEHQQFATKEILDRVWGKPAQSLEVKGEMTTKLEFSDKPPTAEEFMALYAPKEEGQE